MQTRWNDGQFTATNESLVWMASPTVRRYLHLLVSGHPDCDWPTYVEWRHLAPVLDSALVVGCGSSGWLERGLALRGRFRRIVASDFAPAAVEMARRSARERKLGAIEYGVLDLETEALGGPYDAIFANDVLHHVTNLEGVYARIHEALRPGGTLIFNEYVGPNRFQYGEERMELINRYFRLLPDRLRVSPISNTILSCRIQADPVRLAADDPTEAVRSEDVLPLARRYFDVEAEYPYGGGLLNPLLYEIIANFDEQNPHDSRLLRVLCDAEDRLTRSHLIEPDFSVFVGRRGSTAQRSSS